MWTQPCLAWRYSHCVLRPLPGPPTTQTTGLRQFLTGVRSTLTLSIPDISDINWATERERNLRESYQAGQSRPGQTTSLISPDYLYYRNTNTAIKPSSHHLNSVIFCFWELSLICGDCGEKYWKHNKECLRQWYVRSMKCKEKEERKLNNNEYM